jgi:hypothetical protein
MLNPGQAFELGEFVSGEVNRHLHCHGHRVGREHEAPNFIVAALVVRYGLQQQLGNPAGVVAVGQNLHGI